MNKIKKILAVLSALLIVARIFLVSVSAAMLGAGTMAGIIAIIAAALVASGGYTQTQVNSMSNNDIIYSYRIGIESGTIDPKQRIELPDGITYDGSKFATVVDCYVDYNKLVYNGWSTSWKDGKEMIDNVIDNWFSAWYSAWGYDNTIIDDYVIPSTKDQICPYPMYGYGAMCERTDRYGNKSLLYSNYIVISGDLSFTSYVVKLERIYFFSYNSWNEYGSNGNNLTQYFESQYTYKFYGDVRYEDGTPAIELETEYVIGETEDGTKVMPDMLNPDGTVTIDGVTYAPTDYLDLDYFTDPAIIDLLNQILNSLDNANVIAPDTTQDLVDSITDSITSELDVADELTDYIVPTGILSVFPFCLPVDFVRGIQLLSAKPVAPVLEIPFDVPEFGMFKGYKTTLTIEFEKYDKYFSVFRWGIYFCFVFTMIFISTKIVKGAGA